MKQLALLGCCLILTVFTETGLGQVRFTPQLLTIDANEGIAAGDVDGDGNIDLVAGRNWYQGPNWVSRPVRIIEDWNGYVQSNGDFLFDINGDGRLDVVAGSFLPGQIHWYENPGAAALRLGKVWKQHLLVETGHSSNEGQQLHDLDQDGIPEWIVNSWTKDSPMMVWRFEATANEESGARYTLSPFQINGVGNGHGMGVGDLNGDGRLDILSGQGWFEQPESTWSTSWKLHRQWDLQASLPIIVTDLDGDGRNDLIVGKGHDYGLYWWRNQINEDGSLSWVPHEIDKQYSQPHTLAWVDIDGDGAAELITGKRYFAHNGNDPGGQEPPCLYYYDWDQEKQVFQRHTIDEGHIGCGLQLVTQDLNADGKMDIAVAGKSGTWVLLQK